MKNKLKIFFIVIVLLAVLSVLAKDHILKSVITAVVGQVTGAKVTIDGFSLGIVKQSVRIKGFTIYNPKGFSDGVLASLPVISVDCNLASFLKNKAHLKLLEINLKEIVIEKNVEGKLNVDALKVAQVEQTKTDLEKKQGKTMPMQIDVFTLQMDRLVFKDYSAGKEPSIKAYEINLKKSYKDISSVEQLVALIVSEPMKHAGIQGAKIYGAALLTGVGVIPITIASKFMAKDSAEENFDVAAGKLYDIIKNIVRKSGKLIQEDKEQKMITALVNGAKVTVKLKALSAKSTQVVVSARKTLMPKPEIAAGILYQITEKLK